MKFEMLNFFLALLFFLFDTVLLLRLVYTGRAILLQTKRLILRHSLAKE